MGCLVLLSLLVVALFFGQCGHEKMFFDSPRAFLLKLATLVWSTLVWFIVLSGLGWGGLFCEDSIAIDLPLTWLFYRGQDWF